MTTRPDAFATATEMLAALRTKRVSSVELLELHRRRAERYNPTLNALVELDFDRARDAAQEADARRARGEDAPLLGLPMTLKESYNVVGLRTTCGMPFWADFRSQHDAPVTTRVREAGGVIMAKTNVPQMLADWQSSNPVYGRTNNPWDLTRTPGGSTGGGSAALAAGLTPLEYGSDIGGSIRVPAAFCGVYGHRPSETAFPRTGQFPFPPPPNAAVVMGVQGPMARSAADLMLGFDVGAGPDTGEDVAWRLRACRPRSARSGSRCFAPAATSGWTPGVSASRAGRRTTSSGTPSVSRCARHGASSSASGTCCWRPCGSGRRTRTRTSHGRSRPSSCVARWRSTVGRCSRSSASSTPRCPPCRDSRRRRSQWA